MTKTKNLLIMIGVLPLFILFTNAGKVDLSAAGKRPSASFKRMDPSQLLNEVQSLITKRAKGLYGVGEGDKLMRTHQNILVNVYSKQLGAKDCHDIQKNIPGLSTGVYLLGDGSFKKCVHKSTTTISTMAIAL